MGELQVNKILLAPLGTLTAILLFWFAGEIQVYGETLVTYGAYGLSGLVGTYVAGVLVEMLLGGG